MSTGIMIIGPSGSGKTTLGKIVAQKLGYLYFDVDDYIWKQNTDVEAVQNREKVEFQLDTLLWGTEDEKEAVIHDLGKGVEDIERRVREYRRNQGTVNHNRQRSCEAVH